MFPILSLTNLKNQFKGGTRLNQIFLFLHGRASISFIQLKHIQSVLMMLYFWFILSYLHKPSILRNITICFLENHLIFENIVCFFSFFFFSQLCNNISNSLKQWHLVLLIFTPDLWVLHLNTAGNVLGLGGQFNFYQLLTSIGICYKIGQK